MSFPYTNTNPQDAKASISTAATDSTKTYKILYNMTFAPENGTMALDFFSSLEEAQAYLAGIAHGVHVRATYEARPSMYVVMLKHKLGFGLFENASPPVLVQTYRIAEEIGRVEDEMKTG